VDEFGAKKKHLTKLLNLLKEEYPFLTQANRVCNTKRVAAARKDEVILFGSSNKYDFKVISSKVYEDSFENYPLFFLSEDWTQVKNRLAKFASANYPEQYFIDDRPYCCVPDIVYVDNDRDWEDIFVVTSTSSRKKKVAPVRRTKVVSSSKLQADKISVFHNFVKVGWDVYDIYLNEDDEEYVKIDGNVYWIDRDSRGKGKLSV
jgi:hypothetical protein